MKCVTFMHQESKICIPLSYERGSLEVVYTPVVSLLRMNS